MILWLIFRKLAMVSIFLMGSIAISGTVDAGSLRLTWQDTSTNEAGFKIERQSGGSVTQLATVGSNVTSYTDSGVTNGTVYCYRVRAFNASGTSTPSNQACANATIPSGTVPVGSGTNGSTSGTGGSPSPTGSGSGSGSVSYIGGRWTDYRVTMKMKSTDNDGIGVMFRYVDDQNYYRFSWSVQEGYRRLEKIQNGVATVLSKDSVPYVVGRTYQLEIIAQSSTLKVLIDGAAIFSHTDSSFDSGTIALYSNYNSGTIFDDIVVQDFSSGAVLLSENFNDGKFTGWTIINEGTEEGPAVWSATSGALVQSRNLGSYTPTRRGTYALYTKASWTDYRVTMKMRSSDNDVIGVMFRYVDNENYYRFSWSINEGRLEKIQNGVVTVLAKDSVRYNPRQTYQLEIIARDSRLSVLIDGATVLSHTDSSFDGGSIALYSHYNMGSSFDDVAVRDLNTGAILLSENFNRGNFVGWTIIDEGAEYGPSAWSAANGTLVQNSNLGTKASSRPGTYALY